MRVTRVLLARTFAAILALLALASSALAQQAANPAETRAIIVNVLDRRGVPVRDLTKDNFLAHINGKPAAVADAQYGVAPRRIVALLDVSSSMHEPIDWAANMTISQGSFKWRVAHETLDALLTQTPQEVPIAVLTFASHIRDRFDFFQDRAAIVKWSDLGPGQQPVAAGKDGYTALYDAVAEGLKLFGRPQLGDSMYAITDGGDDASKSPLPRTKAALLQSGVRLFALFPPGSMHESRSVDSLIELANDSGGMTFGDPDLRRSPFADGYREKVRAFTQVLNARVSGFWTLQLAAPASKKESKLKLEIVGREGKARNDVVLAYPRALAAK